MTHKASVKTVNITIHELFALQICAAQLSHVNSKMQAYRCWCHMTTGTLDKDSKYSDLHTKLCHDLQRVMKSYDTGIHPNDKDD